MPSQTRSTREPPAARKRGRPRREPIPITQKTTPARQESGPTTEGEAAAVVKETVLIKETRTQRACETCRLRKVKCNGEIPCQQCLHFNMSCVLRPPSQKRKTPIRGRLVAQIKSLNSTAEQPRFARPVESAKLKPPLLPSLSDDSNLAVDETRDTYNKDYMRNLVPQYEDLVYPMSPIITSEEVLDSIEAMRESAEDAALIYAFAAVTINLGQTSWKLNGNVADQMVDLIERSLEAHRKAEMQGFRGHYVDEEFGYNNTDAYITVKRIMTCVFLEISMMAFKNVRRSLLILREATAMVQTLNVHQHDWIDNGLPASEKARRERLYWEVYIHERFMTVVSGYPSILPMLSTGPPRLDGSILQHVDLGFGSIVRLFSIVDDEFLKHCSARHDIVDKTSSITAEWVEAKQAQLDEHEEYVQAVQKTYQVAGRGGLNELQHADLYVTRLWLRTLLWQLALHGRLLHSAAVPSHHEGLSLHFPVRRLSSDLRGLVCQLDNSAVSIGRHGSGILQKLCEITSTAAEVLTTVVVPWEEDSDGRELQMRMEDFVFLVRFLFGFERMPKKERDYLRGKMRELERMYPSFDFGDLTAESPNEA
ncbi:hypothetical protein S40288_05540 [Stachybotrys chartarum IBT 40288]|nr:hypothetical protein S40288_05540 [Stachybotrys chartarum IBT 40288]